MTNARPVILIDFSALFRRAWHVQSDVSHAYEATIGGVNRASASLPDALIAVCCDGRGNWRKELSPTYKANRESQPAQLYGEMDRTLDRLRKDGRLIWKFDGFEADDVIASATMMAKTRGHTVRIVSHDKDLLQLLGPSVDFLAIHKTPWEVATAEVVREKYGVEAEQLGDWLALVGDSSDNVKGCPGVGAKTATILIQTFGNLNALNAAAVAGDPRLTPNVQKNIVASQADIATARQLVSLSREVPIHFDEIYESREIAPIDERDTMKEAEADAAEYFGQENQISEGPRASDTPETESSATQPAEPMGATDSPPAAAPVVVETTALVPTVEYARQLEPRSFKDAVIAAEILFNSRVYSRYPTKQSMVAAIVRGREMGYGLGASLDMFHVADFNRDGNLRFMMHAHLIIEQAARHPDVEYIMLISSTDTECTYEAKRRSHPKPTTLQYTIEDAKRANLMRSGSNWEKRPKEQLRKTCGVQISRVIAPGAALGLYCPEEMGIDHE